MSTTELKVPDIGDFDKVDVIEVLVKAGDSIEPEQSLITVESDKASMEIPAEQGGVVQEVLIKVGDKVAQGDVLVRIEAKADAASAQGGSDAGKAEGRQQAASAGAAPAQAQADAARGRESAQQSDDAARSSGTA